MVSPARRERSAGDASSSILWLIRWRLISAHARRQSPNHARKHFDHVVRLVTDLCRGEAKSLEPGGGMSLVPALVLCLLGGRAVVAKPVGLDDQTQFAPVEIDAVPIDPLLGLPDREAGPLYEREKPPFQP